MYITFARTRVVFKPGMSLNPISDESGNIEIESEALANNRGKFGHLDGAGAGSQTLMPVLVMHVGRVRMGMLE